MAVKTITITIDAYEALRSLKSGEESFSSMILRIAKRKPLSTFFGALRKDSGERVEKAIKTARTRRNMAHRLRVERIAKGLK